MANARVDPEELGFGYRAGQFLREQALPAVGGAVGSMVDTASLPLRTTLTTGQNIYAGITGQPGMQEGYSLMPFRQGLRQAMAPQQPAVLTTSATPTEAYGGIAPPAQQGLQAPGRVGEALTTRATEALAPSPIGPSAVPPLEIPEARGVAPAPQRPSLMLPGVGGYSLGPSGELMEIIPSSTDEGTLKMLGMMGYEPPSQLGLAAERQAQAGLTRAQTVEYPATAAAGRGLTEAQTEEARRVPESRFGARAFTQDVPTTVVDQYGRVTQGTRKQAYVLDEATGSYKAVDMPQQPQQQQVLPPKETRIAGRYYNLPQGRFKWDGQKWVK